MISSQSHCEPEEENHDDTSTQPRFINKHKFNHFTIKIKKFNRENKEEGEISYLEEMPLKIVVWIDHNLLRKFRGKKGFLSL